MQGTSNEFQQAVQSTHQAVSRVYVIQDSKVVLELDVYEGSVSSDATAAQMRAFTASVGDPTGTLTPTDINSLLAPFGTRIQPMRGVIVPAVAFVVALDDSAESWATGTNNGTTQDPDTGDLILGWH